MADPNSTSRSPDAPPETPDYVSTPELKELEKEVFEGGSARVWTLVKSWAREEGQEKGPDKIDYYSWGDETKAEQDLQKIFLKVPEFKTIFEKAADSSPSKRKELLRLISSKLKLQDDLDKKNKVERAELSEEVGSNFLSDTIDQGFDLFDDWKKEGTAGALKIAGTAALTYFVVFKGIKAAWNGIKGLAGSESWVQNLVVGGGLLGAGWWAVVNSIFSPKSAHAATEGLSQKKYKDVDFGLNDPSDVNTPADLRRIENTIETKEGAKAFFGLLQTPSEKVLDAYEKAENGQIDPKFLLSHIGGLKGFDRKWAREMVKKINPTTLYDVVNSTILLFEKSPNFLAAKKIDPTLTAAKYVRREYVDKAKLVGTTIEFPELIQAAMSAFSSGAANPSEFLIAGASIDNETWLTTFNTRVAEFKDALSSFVPGEAIADVVAATYEEPGKIIVFPFKLVAGESCEINYDPSSEKWKFGSQEFTSPKNAIKAVIKNRRS